MVEAQALSALRARVERQVFGKRHVVDLALVCVLAGGHLLLEDVPGVGKTTLGLALARAIGGAFRRLQFTSDLLPADILGGSVLDPRDGSLRFRPGPIFTNVLLADELNRTPPRTQSALLEAMNEGQVSMDGESSMLPDPFFVIATQNPHELHGTWPLPDSQLDRFLLRTSMGYPDRQSERSVLRGDARRGADADIAVSLEVLRSLKQAVSVVRVHEEIEDYVLDIVHATRTAPSIARGASTRGAEALLRAARAHALLAGRDFVIPEDVRTLVVPVLAHRIVPRAESGAEAAAAVLRDVLNGVGPPG